MLGRGRFFVIFIAVQMGFVGVFNTPTFAATCSNLFQSEPFDSRSVLFPNELQREKNPDLLAANIETYVFGQRIAVPYGLRPKDFDKMVRLFRQAPAALDLQGLIVFGSRTHFSYGTVPTATSDIDVLAFGKSDSQIDFISTLEQTLAQAYNGEVPVNHFPLTAADEYPPSRSFSWYLDNVLDPLTVNQASARWNRFFSTHARSLADEYLPFINDDPVDAKNLLKMQWYENSNERINKDAVFLIRQSEHSQEWIRRLREMGYQHVLEIPAPKP